MNLSQHNAAKPRKPSEIPKPERIPEVKPVKEPNEPVFPERNPEIIPEKEPEEPGQPYPAEIPPARE
jgi:hypothetical protein